MGATANDSLLKTAGIDKGSMALQMHMQGFRNQTLAEDTPHVWHFFFYLQKTWAQKANPTFLNWGNAGKPHNKQVHAHA